ncbi:MAG: hypothetical protein EXR86_02855 [Gammaproteobacteria bacterium]|nr:hypothetical protein [Gammaproteobacteria bacterium]
MSTPSVAAFVAGYIVIALLLANLLFCTRWRWWIKLAALLWVAGLFQITYRSLPDLLGWPTARSVPERFNLMGLHIVEPDKSGSTKGDIYLWVTDLNLDGSARVPRAFVVPFHPELQVKLIAAGTKLRKGLPQLGEQVDTPFESGPATLGHADNALNLDFYDMPDPLFPER